MSRGTKRRCEKRGGLVSKETLVSGVDLGCLPFTKTIRLEISGIKIKQLHATLWERESLYSISTSARDLKRAEK